jgi:hypothetical protein
MGGGGVVGRFALVKTSNTVERYCVRKDEIQLANKWGSEYIVLKWKSIVGLVERTWTLEEEV